MAAVKTYVLAPNFSYHPNTSICLGDIIQYPDDPTNPLSSIPDADLKPTETHVDYEVTISNNKSFTASGSIWARFCEIASTKFGGRVGKDVQNQYAIERLETVYFRKQPTSEEVAERIQEKKIQAVINSGLCGKQPVFMVTGIKIARGFKLVQTAASTAGTHSALDVPISQTAAGASFEASKSRNTEQQQRTEQDIIFAYQLHVVKCGWWSQNTSDVNVWKPTAAFLDNVQKTDVAEIELEEADETALRGVDEAAVMESLYATDADADCVCVFFGEP